MHMLTGTIIGIFVIGGLAAGFLTGLLGIGGGAVLVPVLYQSFLHAGWEPRVAINTAIATSLSVMIFSSSRAFVEYQRQGLIDWKCLRLVVVGSTAGTILGAHLMLGADAHTIRVGFGTLMWALALLTLSPIRERAMVADGVDRPGTWLPYLVVGAGAGVLAAMFGVGGGAVLVPALVLITGMSIHMAIASSTAAIAFSALLSSMDYAYQGWDSHSLADGALGWISLPALFILGVASLVSVTHGARLAPRLSPRTLKFGLALLQGGIGGKVIFSG